MNRFEEMLNKGLADSLYVLGQECEFLIKVKAAFKAGAYYNRAQATRLCLDYKASAASKRIKSRYTETGAGFGNHNEPEAQTNSDLRIERQS